MNEIKIGEKWELMGRRLAIALPQWVLNRLDKRSEGKGFVVKAIPFVIMLLSIASITNLAGRAFLHHKDYSAYATGAGIAVLVPVAVIAAMLIDGWWAKLFWGMAFLFALVSGTIQYNIYLMPSSGIMGIAEAIAFGYGVPVSEVMLAIMETRLVIQHDKKKAAEEAAAKAAAKAAQDEAAAKAEADRLRLIAEQQAAEERQRQAELEAERREFDRQRKQAELEAYRIELQQKAQIERERAFADLRIKEQKALAKTASKGVQNTVQNTVQSDKKTGGEQQNERSEMDIILDIYRKDSMASLRSVGRTINRSPSTISNWLDQWEAEGFIHRNGNGVEVLTK